jgi:hypothetical protein
MNFISRRQTRHTRIYALYAILSVRLQLQTLGHSETVTLHLTNTTENRHNNNNNNNSNVITHTDPFTPPTFQSITVEKL